MFSSQSIDFSCYVKGEVAEWLLDSGCTKHITPVRSNLHNYKESNPPGKAEIADGKFITIKGQGNIIGHSLLPDKTKFSMEIRCVLYVPDASTHLRYPIIPNSGLISRMQLVLLMAATFTVHHQHIEGLFIEIEKGLFQ